MKLALFTNSISPHQLPLAKALMAKVGVENYKYIYTDELTQERQRMGWGDAVDSSWCQQGNELYSSLIEADVVMSGLRALNLFEKRIAAGKKTVYVSERWFKPPLGFFRIFVASYFKMAKRFVKCLTSTSMSLMPMGIHAARDMARLFNFMRGDVRSLFGAPRVAFESKPGGVIVPLKEAIRAGILSKEEIAFGKKYGFVQIPREHWGRMKPQGIYAKMRLWGYFVEPGDKPQNTQMDADVQDCQCEDNHESTRKDAASVEIADDDSIRNSSFGNHNFASSLRGVGGHSLPIKHPPRVLWVGRMLDLKRVRDLVRAVSPNKDLKRARVLLSLYGKGPEEASLKALAKGCENISFHDFVPIAEVRNLMRKHDVYILPSNAYEGWGAVVSEALEEGMKVIGTVDAGSTATILPPTHLYKAGDVKRLATLLSNPIVPLGIGEWSAENAAKRFLEFVKQDLFLKRIARDPRAIRLHRAISIYWTPPISS